jgi:hypothetical protein
MSRTRSPVEFATCRPNGGEDFFVASPREELAEGLLRYCKRRETNSGPTYSAYCSLWRQTEGGPRLTVITTVSCKSMEDLAFRITGEAKIWWDRAVGLSGVPLEAVSVFDLCLTILKDGALSGAEIGLEREDRYGSFVPVLDLLPDDVHCSERLLSRARWSTSTRSGGGSDA